MTLAGFFAPVFVYALVTLLHLLVPARHVEGYVVSAETGKPLRYRLNGLIVFVLVMAIWSLVCSLGWLDWDFFWTTRFEGLAGACVFGLLFTFAVVLTEPSTGKGMLAELYLGRAENPQWLGGRIDAKMWLYLIGATMLGLNIYSFAMHHFLTHPDDVSYGVVVYAGLFTFFLVEYLFFERVHLYTYDFFAERVGFKLGWGCLLFYPYFYCVGLWSVAELPDPNSSTAWLVASAAIFFAGWSLARGANMQKYAFKRDPNRKFLGAITPLILTDGKHKLLANGFWGVSRHVNYLGEFLMAIGLALSLGYPSHIGPWLYPLYYVALLLPRQLDDDRRCAEKYKALWKEYVAKVPYRIVPFVY